MLRATSGTATNLEDDRGRLASGAVELAVHHPHDQPIDRFEVALEPVEDAAVGGGEDQVTVLLDRLDDLLGDALGSDGAALEERDQLAHFRVVTIDPD